MKRLLPGCRAVLMAVLLVGATLVQASGGGSGDGDAGDSNIDVYLALGAAAILGAILLFDVFSGPEPEAAADAVAVEAPPIEDTGVDWESVTEEVEIPVLAVSVFSGPGGDRATELALLGYLRDAGGSSLEIYPDPLDLGLGSPAEESALAREFFGAGYYLYGSLSDTSLVLELYSGTEGPLWTRAAAPGDTTALRTAASDLASEVAGLGDI